MALLPVVKVTAAAARKIGLGCWFDDGHSYGHGYDDDDGGIKCSRV